MKTKAMRRAKGGSGIARILRPSNYTHGAPRQWTPARREAWRTGLALLRAGEPLDRVLARARAILREGGAR